MRATAWSLDEFAMADGFGEFTPAETQIPTQSAGDLEADVQARLAVEQSRSEAAAYSRGRADGERAARASVDQEIASAMALLSDALHSVQLHESRWVSNAEENVAALAVMVARHIVQREVHADPSFVRDVVQSAMAQYPLDQEITIRTQRRSSADDDLAADDRRPAAPEQLARHPPAAGRLDLIEHEPPIGRAQGDAVPVCHDSAGRVAHLRIDRVGPPDEDPAALGLEEGTRPWLEGSNHPVQFDRWPARIEPTILAPERAGQRRPDIRLRVCLDLAPDPGVQRVSQQVRSQRRQPGVQARGGVRSIDADPSVSDERARVETRIHAEQGHPGRLVAGEDSCRKRRRAAMPRQQGRVDVEGAQTQVEDGLRDDLAVVGQHGEVRLERGDGGERVR